MFMCMCDASPPDPGNLGADPRTSRPDIGNALPLDFGYALPPDFGNAPPPDIGNAPPPDFGNAPPPFFSARCSGQCTNGVLPTAFVAPLRKGLQ